MVVYDESGNRVSDFDVSKGSLEVRERVVVHEYKVDVERQTHFEVIAEYPETGGKDVKEVVDVEEQGHWDTTDVDTGEDVPDYDGIIPDEWPHELKFQEAWQYGVYHAYTDVELEQIERELEEARKKADDSAKVPDRVTSVEEQITNIQLALAELYEGGM